MVVDRVLEQEQMVFCGLLNNVPDIEPLPKGWALTGFGCEHERYPRHHCLTLMYQVFVLHYMVVWALFGEDAYR